jgi:hypothetical protein
MAPRSRLSWRLCSEGPVAGGGGEGGARRHAPVAALSLQVGDQERMLRAPRIEEGPLPLAICSLEEAVQSPSDLDVLLQQPRWGRGRMRPPGAAVAVPPCSSQAGWVQQIQTGCGLWR